MRIGFIGLGNIGGPCARHLVDAGHDVTVGDLADDARARLVAHGASEGATPGQVADGAEAVILSLPSPAASEAVVAGDGGVLETAAAGTVVVDLSTSSVATTRRLHDRCRASDVHFVDCPVSGGNVGAEAGELSLMPSGDRDAFDRVRDALVCFGRDDTTWLGPSGTGTLVKLINNQLFLVGNQVFQEGYLLAAKAGLDVHTLMAAVRASSGGMFAPLADLVINRRWEESSYDLALADKDLRLVLETADEIGTPMPLTAAASAVLSRSVDAGLGAKFFLASSETLEADAGFTAPIPRPPEDPP